MLWLIAGVAAVAVVRAANRVFFERRALERRPLGPDGVIVGATPIDLPLDGAPAVLLLHGGGDTPQIVSGLAHHLHARGYAVRVPLLAGHGRALPDWRRVTADAWHAQVRDEYDALRKQHAWVGIVGLSMGGALAVSFAAAREDIPALVLLAPYLAMPGSVRFAAATSHAWGVALPYAPSGGGRSIRDAKAAAAGLGHGVFTPTALRALASVVDAARQALPRVHAPTLVVQSREDNRIPRALTEQAFSILGAPEKQMIWTEGAGHVITVDYGHERVFDLTERWLASHGAEKRTAKSPMV